MHDSTWPQYIIWVTGIFTVLMGVKFLTSKQDYKLNVLMKEKRDKYKFNMDNLSVSDRFSSRMA
jgi:hypothetical protein